MIIFWAIIAVFLYCLYSLWDSYGYWRRKGIVGPTPLPIVGNYGSVILHLKREIDVLSKIYTDYPDEKVIGIYIGTKPALILKDPEIIKRVMLKDFDNFRDRFCSDFFIQYDKSLFLMSGDKRWKLCRQIVGTVLTKLKLTNMFPLLNCSINKYLEKVKARLQNSADFEIHTLSTIFLRTVLIDIFLGVDHLNMKHLETISRHVARVEQLDVLRALDGISFAKFVMAPFLRHQGTKLYSFFNNFITTALDQQKDSEQNNSFLNSLAELTKKGKNKTKNHVSEIELDNEFLVQNAATIMLASLSTISTTISGMVHELVQNQDVQQKCYEEITRVFKECINGEITADTVTEFTYLDMVLDETLRKHSPLVLDRKCSSKYTFPDNNLTIDEGVSVLVPLEALHNDVKYYPNPWKFVPERFSPENRAKISNVYLPFGDGPRYCIGKQLTKMIIVPVMAVLLKEYKIVPSALTEEQISYDPRMRTRLISGEIWATILKRNEDKVE